MTLSVGAMQQLTASLSTLGSQLAAAAPTGSFDSVLSQVNSEVAALSGGQAATSEPGAVLTGSQLLGTGPTPPGPGSVKAAALSSGPAGAGLAPTGAQVVADAKSYLGVPYQWGGTDPTTGLDCSGLVQLVYSNLGISLPRTSEEQATVGTPVASVAAAQPGDLVFYEPSAAGPGHVGIYIGNGQMINAPHTGTSVQIDPVGTPSEIRRIIPTASSPALSTASLLGTASVLGTGRSGPPAAGMESLGVPAALQPLFQAAGQSYGVDPLLLASVAKQESGFQTNAVSGAGAQGLMQLMPATAAGLGVSAFDPASAIDGAAQLLSGYLQNYGGSVPDALAAYNAGPGAVAAYGGVPPYSETENYVSSITAMLAQAQAAGGTGVAR